MRERLCQRRYRIDLREREAEVSRDHRVCLAARDALLDDVQRHAAVCDGRGTKGDARIDNDDAISTARIPAQGVVILVIELDEPILERSFPKELAIAAREWRGILDCRQPKIA